MAMRIARKRTKKRHKEIRGLSEEEGRRGVADQKEQLQAQSRKRPTRKNGTSPGEKKSPLYIKKRQKRQRNVRADRWIGIGF